MAVIDSPGPGRVLIALSDGPLVPEPTWTRYDNIIECRNLGYQCFTGRQSELDTTGTGSASVFFQDQDRTLDDSDLVGCQIMLQLYNPVLAQWEIRWRGQVDEIQRGLVDTPGYPLADTTITAVGIFDYLGGVKFRPGTTMGHPGGPLDTVFYDDGAVDDRINKLLEDALIDSTMRITFSGNVWVNESQYDPDDVILQAIRDACDAEFPGVANFYEDRFGRCVFTGGSHRFDPEGTEATAPGSWEFTRWAAATREDVAGVVAQIRTFGYNIPRARIINSYLAWPKEDEEGLPFDREEIPDLLATNSGSITAYGYRGDEAPDLIIKHNRNDFSQTGQQECALFGEFYVQNYHQPRKAVQNITFLSTRPDDARAAATWNLMCQADISDAIHLTIDEAGLSDEAFFIDGITIECRFLNPDYDLVTFTPNLTPASYYGTDVFTP